MIDYQQARKIYFLAVFASIGLTVTLYIISSPTITIEYFAIHMIIVLFGFLWVKKKKLGA